MLVTATVPRDASPGELYQVVVAFALQSRAQARVRVCVRERVSLTMPNYTVLS